MDSQYRFVHRRSGKSRFAWGLLHLLIGSAISVLLARPQAYASGRVAEAARAPTLSTPAVTMRAASGATIPFRTQNGNAVGSIPSQALDLPYLVLYRNGALTQADERTLILEVSGIEVTAPGVTVTLEIETQHVDPTFSGEADQRISVWQESRWIDRSLNAPGTGVTALFSHTFGATIVSGGEQLATPTDYFRYKVAVTDADHPPANPLYAFGVDHAFLMESQWVARLPEVREESPGAAPNELVVYTCDMFPFRKDRQDPATWLPRADVTAYVGGELLPRMVEAFRVQTDEWGFPWTPAWIGYRPEDPERLSVALSEGQTWFHGWAPTGGHSGISINVSRGIDSASYDTLTDGLLSRFHHELFHNLQRNLNLSLGGDGRVDGAENAWQLFTEGTAVLASSVGQPDIQFAPSLPRRTYMRTVNASLLWDVGRFQDLIVNDQEPDSYSAAVYWRFLYEQCGGMHEGIEDPAAGMQIVRRALTALYAGGMVDLDSPADLMQATSEVLDRALVGSACPFQTYRESLTAFAHALYALRLDGGRCTRPGLPAGCSFYDPHHLYREPHLRTVPFAGAAREVRHDLPGSFGLAFVDVIFGPATDGQALTIEFDVPPALGAEVYMQVVQLVGSDEGSSTQPTPVRLVATDVPAEVGPDGRLTYAIPEIRTADCNRLGLIITRLDVQESSGPAGKYSIKLRPGADHLPEAADDRAHTFGREATEATTDAPPPLLSAQIEPSAVQVTLSAADTSASWDGRRPEAGSFDLPVLYLNHNGQAAAEAERTLTLSLSGLAGGAPVEIEIISWHEDRATWEHHRQTQSFLLPDRICSAQDPCVVRWPLDAATLSDDYRLTVRDDEGRVLWENPEPERPDLVALDTWEVGLDSHTVRIYYARLFPFARGEKALYHRLTPDAVDDFIAHQFVPIVVETWKTQFGDWGYGPIHPAWDADKVVEVIFTGPPFALFGGTGTYTASTYADGSPYPERRIWLQTSHNTLQAYDSLENGFKVIFSHEFHHTAQWNVLLSTGCPARKWVNLFIEAQAKVASSVQYPELELSTEHLTAPASEYSSAALRFLEQRLEASYADMEADQSDPYDAALYWRFLYEHSGGMRVLRVALEEMACRPVGDVPVTLEEVMDAVLVRLNGPLADFEESLEAFARANYALRLENGRCTSIALETCGGKYDDPEGIYVAPAPEAELTYTGAPLAYTGSIPASFGTDFVEISLDAGARGQPVEVVFRSEGARFSVQVWRLVEAEGKVRAITPQPERLSGDCSTECHYTYSGADMAQVDRLALIVVRLDPYEREDGAGSYSLAI